MRLEDIMSHSGNHKGRSNSSGSEKSGNSAGKQDSMFGAMTGTVAKKASAAKQAASKTFWGDKKSEEEKAMTAMCEKVKQTIRDYIMLADNIVPATDEWRLGDQILAAIDDEVRDEEEAIKVLNEIASKLRFDKDQHMVCVVDGSGVAVPNVTLDKMIRQRIKEIGANKAQAAAVIERQWLIKIAKEVIVAMPDLQRELLTGEVGVVAEQRPISTNISDVSSEGGNTAAAGKPKSRLPKLHLPTRGAVQQAVRSGAKTALDNINSRGARSLQTTKQGLQYVRAAATSAQRYVPSTTELKQGASKLVKQAGAILGGGRGTTTTPHTVATKEKSVLEIIAAELRGWIEHFPNKLEAVKPTIASDKNLLSALGALDKVCKTVPNINQHLTKLASLVMIDPEDLNAVSITINDVNDQPVKFMLKISLPMRSPGETKLPAVRAQEWLNVTGNKFNLLQQAHDVIKAHLLAQKLAAVDSAGNVIPAPIPRRNSAATGGKPTPPMLPAHKPTILTAQPAGRGVIKHAAAGDGSAPATAPTTANKPKVPGGRPAPHLYNKPAEPPVVPTRPVNPKKVPLSGPQNPTDDDKPRDGRSVSL
jgi:hypothetical protein